MMRRYFSQDKIDRIAKDFAFLINKVNTSCGELDFRLREGYFNIYYQGNSLAYVGVSKKEYRIRIHEKFLERDVFKDDERFAQLGKSQGVNREFRLKTEDLKPFFQQKYLKRIQSNIKRVVSSEEITFEHILITDNLDRVDLIIIDRQVTETELHGKRIDLLALQQMEENQYQFKVIEVKLGKNPELRFEVLNQLSAYVQHIEDHFDNWKISYEKTYSQMKQLGLLQQIKYDEIVIQPGVNGLIAVGGYSGMAKQYLLELERDIGDFQIRHFINQF